MSTSIRNEQIIYIIIYLMNKAKKNLRGGSFRKEPQLIQWVIAIKNKIKFNFLTQKKMSKSVCQQNGFFTEIIKMYETELSY